MLYGSGNSNRGSVQTRGVGWEGGSKRRGYMYTYGWFMLRFDRKQQNSVKQLSFNVKKKKKRILELVAIPFSRGSSWPRNWTQVSCVAGRFFTVWTIGKTKFQACSQAAHLYTYIFFQIIFHYRLLWDIEYSFLCLFMRLFNKHLPSAYYVPEIILGTRVTSMNNSL